MKTGTTIIIIAAILLLWVGSVALTLWSIKDEVPEEPITQEQLEAEVMIMLAFAPVFAFLIALSYVSQLFGRIFRRNSDEG